ncbi:hypothetical protein VTJ49DRAFT_1643 [Mycothermus thermophilus]|uniref:Uncharacterized protein n=1 Tax=Humicola insolens TaxID=85995 RepID=A0ABR3VBX7_HUMIN
MEANLHHEDASAARSGLPSAAQSNWLTFFDLPSEIRNKIYDAVLFNPDGVWPGDWLEPVMVPEEKLPDIAPLARAEPNSGLVYKPTSQCRV